MFLRLVSTYSNVRHASSQGNPLPDLVSDFSLSLLTLPHSLLSLPLSHRSQFSYSFPQLCFPIAFRGYASLLFPSPSLTHISSQLFPLSPLSFHSLSYLLFHRLFFTLPCLFSLSVFLHVFLLSNFSCLCSFFSSFVLEIFSL
jgi:hypothetical protein